MMYVTIYFKVLCREILTLIHHYLEAHAQGMNEQDMPQDMTGLHAFNNNNAVVG